ncbi:MAG TPA: DUF2125 domain-containing protein [Aestuariivirga sp.]|nr:DUF2125 domain-containing protein [Aestuariivirga sp.]
MKATRKRPSGRLAPLTAIIVLSTVWSIYWYVARQRAELFAQGLSLLCASENWGGYPLRFEFSCISPTVNFSSGLTVRSAALFAVAQAYVHPM